MYILVVPFRGQKTLGPRPGRSRGFNSKFPTSIPTPFICGVPPRDEYAVRICYFSLENGSLRWISTVA